MGIYMTVQSFYRQLFLSWPFLSYSICGLIINLPSWVVIKIIALIITARNSLEEFYAAVCHLSKTRWYT